MNRVFPSLVMMATLALSICFATITPAGAVDSKAWLDPPGIAYDVTDSNAMLSTADHIDMILDQGFPGVDVPITNDVTRIYVDYTCLMPGGEPGGEGGDEPDPPAQPDPPNPGGTESSDFCGVVPFYLRT